MVLNGKMKTRNRPYHACFWLFVSLDFFILYAKAVDLRTASFSDDGFSMNYTSLNFVISCSISVDT